ELGVGPAMEAGGGRHASFDRRKVSLRWFTGTLLTGLSGGALIGAAIYAALGHQTYFAEAPAPSITASILTRAIVSSSPLISSRKNRAFRRRPRSRPATRRS